MLCERLKLSRTELLEGDLVKSGTDLVPRKYKQGDEGYNLSDLVLPIIGFASEIPENLQGWVDTYFPKLGINQEYFNHKNKEFRMVGTYRNVFVRFDEDKHFEYEFVEYGEENVDLQTELGGWEKIEFTLGPNQKPKTALRIKFNLPTSAYATMACRELLHNDDVT